MYPDVMTEAGGSVDKYAQDAGMQLAQIRRPTKRQQLQQQRQVIAAKLSDIDGAIAALDAHPELEEFIETLQRANY